MDTTAAKATRIPGKGSNRDYDRWQAQCPCGWHSLGVHSNRTVEGRRLADRDAVEHLCPADVAGLAVAEQWQPRDESAPTELTDWERDLLSN